MAKNRVLSGFERFIQKRGIRIKLTLLIAVLVIGTVGGLAAVVLPMQQESITRKAFQTCEVTALSVSAIAADTLLAGQRILLDDIIRGTMNQHVEGLAEISIVFKGKYYVTSDPKKSGQDVPEEMLERLRKATTPVIARSEIVHKQDDGTEIGAFEFTRPIFYQEKRIGYARIVYSKEAIESEVRAVRFRTAITAVIVTLISLGVVYYLAVTISKPVVQVANAAKEVAEGNLDVHLSIDSLDEIGALAEQFNRMVGELKEKLYMSRFVSSSTMEAVKVAAGEKKLELGGERKNLAFFFSDVRGFTAMSEKKSPEDVVSILNAYLDLQTQVIKKFGGDIDKYVGDEIMAVFSGDGKEDRAIQASVAVIEELKAYNKARQEKGEDSLLIGIGLNCGDVVVGNMGSRDRMDFTAIGDAVNLAARLCSAAEPLQVLASENMLRGAKVKYAGKKLEPIRVKGKEKPIQVYDIKGFSKKNGEEPAGV